MTLQSTCGGYVSSARGLLTSPGYPGPYTPDTECEWVVRLRPATMITFSFLDLDIGAESDTECGGDYLVIRNGERASSPFFLINPRQGNNQVSVMIMQKFISPKTQPLIKNVFRKSDHAIHC